MAELGVVVGGVDTFIEDLGIRAFRFGLLALQPFHHGLDLVAIRGAICGNSGQLLSVGFAQSCSIPPGCWIFDPGKLGIHVPPALLILADFARIRIWQELQLLGVLGGPLWANLGSGIERRLGAKG